jgi:serine/threonine protein kinase
MVMGKPPFDSNNMKGLARKVLTGVYPAVSSRYSQEMQDVVKRLLTVNPEQRPSIEQVAAPPRAATSAPAPRAVCSPRPANDAPLRGAV